MKIIPIHRDGYTYRHLHHKHLQVLVIPLLACQQLRYLCYHLCFKFPLLICLIISYFHHQLQNLIHSFLIDFFERILQRGSFDQKSQIGFSVR